MITLVRVTKHQNIDLTLKSTFEKSVAEIIQAGSQLLHCQLGSNEIATQLRDLLVHVIANAEHKIIYIADEDATCDGIALQQSAQTLLSARFASLGIVNLNLVKTDGTVSDLNTILPKSFSNWDLQTVTNTTRDQSCTFVRPITYLTGVLFKKSILLNLLAAIPSSGTALNLSMVINNFIHKNSGPVKRIIPLSVTVTLPLLPSTEELMASANDAFDRGDVQTALTKVEQLSQINPDVPLIDYHYAKCLSSVGRNWEAKKRLDVQLKKAPADPQVLSLSATLEKELPTNGFTYQQIAKDVENVVGYLDPGQEQLLFEIVKGLPDGAVIIEIGSHLGRSTSAMALACVNSQKRIFVVDPWDGGGLGSTRAIWNSNFKRLGLAQYVTPIQGFSQDVMKEWDPNFKADFIFVDGAHWWEEVREDFYLTYPLLKDGGWYAYHDITYHWPACLRAWRQLATPLLANRGAVTSLAFGQKISSQPMPQVTMESPFSFAADFVNFIRETSPNLTDLCNILEASLSPAFSTTSRSSLETALKNLPDFYVDKLINLIGATLSGAYRHDLKDRLEDGVIAYWAGIALAQRGYHDNANQLYMIAANGIVPVPLEQQGIGVG